MKRFIDFITRSEVYIQGHTTALLVFVLLVLLGVFIVYVYVPDGNTSFIYSKY